MQGRPFQTWDATPEARRRIRAWALCSVLLFAAMAICSWPLQPSIPHIQLTFSETAFRSVLAHWKPEGERLFAAHFVIDFPFLISYGVLGYLLTRQTKLFERDKRRRRTLLALTLPVAAAADATENFFHLFFLFCAGPFHQAEYFAAGVAATTKWLLIALFVAYGGYSIYRNGAPESCGNEDCR